MRNVTVAVMVGAAIAGALVPPAAAGEGLEPFKDLVGGRWRAEANWASGHPFVQEAEFRWALDKTIVVVESYGPASADSDELVHRNHGIRASFPEKGMLWFWEFDKTGGLTQGEITFEGDAILHTYGYGEGEQKMKLRDTWTRVDANTYGFKVQQLKDGEWGEPLLDTQFKRIPAGG